MFINRSKAITGSQQVVVVRDIIHKVIPIKVTIILLDPSDGK